MKQLLLDHLLPESEVAVSSENHGHGRCGSAQELRRPQRQACPRPRAPHDVHHRSLRQAKKGVSALHDVRRRSGHPGGGALARERLVNQAT